MKEGACKYDQVVEGNVDTVVGIDHPVEEIRIQVMYLATDLISTGTLPRSGGRQLVCLDSVDFVINSYTCDIPEGVRLVSKKLE